MQTAEAGPRRVKEWPAAAELPAFDGLLVGGLAVLATALLMAVASRYGYHRDELYFVEASRHLAWGYVDQPPLSVALAGLSRMLFGLSLPGLRLFPAVADGGMVLVTGLIARELGGGRFAQGLAALAVAAGPFLVAGHLAGPTIYDFLGWAVTSLLVIRILRTGRDRLWLAVGLVAGVSLLAKETILFLLVGLAIGFLVNRQARIFASPWLWMGLAVALVIWSPTLVWEARHGWPAIEMSRSLHREHSGLGYTLTFLPIQLLLPGWYVAPVWMAGWWALWRGGPFRPYRAFAVAYALLFVIVGVFMGDRPYYIGPLYVVLLAAGAVVTEKVVEGRRRFFSERPPARRVIWRSRGAAALFVLLFAVLMLPVALPILPARTLATVPLQDVNYNLGETIGWQQLLSTVARVYRSLPAPERSSAVILASNYGEAGSVDRYGPAMGLPGAFSGHNSYWWWGLPRPAEGTTIAVGYDPPDFLRRYFRRVTLAARVENAQGVSNDEEGAPVWLCRGQKQPWPRIWPEFKHYG
jgi:hypothetical protein